MHISTFFNEIIHHVNEVPHEWLINRLSFVNDGYILQNGVDYADVLTTFKGSDCVYSDL